MTGARDPGTLDFYARMAEIYVKSDTARVSRHLPGFLARLKPGARILELGCGGGFDAEAMIAAGFEVDPTDGVPEIARAAEARLGRPVRVMCFDELDAVAAYDAVWANASLLHVPRAGLPQVLRAIHRALRPGGLHLASFRASGREGRDRHDRYYNQLTAQELRRLYAEAGPWEEAALVEYTGGSFDPGEELPWLAITLRKPT